jgi:hypothetical protein
MAPETSVEYLLRRKRRKRTNGILPAAIVDVIPGRTVAPLAAGVFGRFFA